MDNILSKFEKYLLENLPKNDSFHPYFEESLAYMLKAGGKRFRPMLLLSVVKSKNTLLVDSSFQIALGLELLHTYSLIHDDLPAMDNAKLRRGLKTIHEKYDEVTAILVGDALNTHAFNLLACAPLHNDTKIDLIKCLSENGGINGMIIGQAIDCKFENQRLSLEQLNYLHLHKTGKLIAASLKMGAIIASYNKEVQDSLYEFGLDLGLLFQIQDDIIDETLSSEEAGKTTQNDKEKNSFVNLLGLKEAIKSADELALKCVKNMDKMDNNLKESLKDLLSKYLFRHNS